MIYGNMFLEYHVDSAGKPNITIPITRYRRSNAANIDRRLQNDFVSLMQSRFLIRKTMLKMFTTKPTIDTSI